MNRNWIVAITAVIVLVLCVCALCLIVAGVVIVGRNVYNQGISPVEMGSPPQSPPTHTPVVVRPTPAEAMPSPTSPNIPTEVPPSATALPTPTSAAGLVPDDSLRAIEQAVIPTSDPIALAAELKGITGLSPTLEPPASYYAVGATQAFWTTNSEDENILVQATLRYVTEHAYFWIDNSVRYNANDLADLANTFEEQIYPTDREFFGSEWTPGVDGDPHIYILYAAGISQDIAGYYSSSDEYPPQINQYSNTHEMFYFNADNSPLNDEYTYGVLAHEFQHMIHWYQDRNESSWLNEGFSELAVLLNDYYSGGFDYLYTSQPDLQLNHWPDNDQEDTSPHYGAGFLFVTYFLDRFGEEATQALVGDPENDMLSVDNVLQQIGAVDPLRGQPITADDVFIDWAVTNYLLDGSVSDGRYRYNSYRSVPPAMPTDDFRDCPVGPLTRDVHQYGVDYIRIACPGSYNLRFEGSIQVPILPANPHSGQFAFWSNRSDESNITLSRSFDFNGIAEPISLSFWTWYELEDGWDYLYLTASVDGTHWEILDTPSGTASNPQGNNYGWGYTGNSGGRARPAWIQETVDLSQYAGHSVQLRFQYVTDPSVTSEGFLLDDISIPAIDYSSDFETNDAGWQASGWVRIRNLLPQTYRLALISFGRLTTVQYVPLTPDMSATIPLSITGDVDEVVLVVTATTRYTRQTAPYRYSVIAP